MNGFPIVSITKGNSEGPVLDFQSFNFDIENVRVDFLIINCGNSVSINREFVRLIESLSTPPDAKRRGGGLNPLLFYQH